MKIKKVPMRMCIVCREMKEKQDLTRIVKDREGKIKVDVTGKSAGRGAYICNNPECVKKLFKHKFLNKIFSQNVPDEIYSEVEEVLLGKKE